MAKSAINTISYNSGVGYSRLLLYFLIFFSFLISMRFWIGWEGRGKYINVIIGTLGLFIMIFHNIRFDFNKKNIIFFILVICAHLFTRKMGVSSIVGLLQYYIIIFLNDEDKINCLKYITKWFGYLMIPSLIIYGLFFVTDLPSFGIQKAVDTDWSADSGYGVCKNYIFYMRSTYETYNYRFNGPFLEPGHVGMMSAFLLYANRFNLSRKGMIMTLIALLFTLSLSGYVLGFIGFIMFLFLKNKIKLSHICLFVIISLVILLFGYYYNGGDNFLNNFILSRLESDEEKGFVGNNRVFGEIDLYFAMLLNDRDLLLWGYPRETMEWLADNGSRGSGWIMSMCYYGLVGTLLLLSFYIYYTFVVKNKKLVILFLIFVLTMFWQRNYPLWTSWIICFLYGIANYNNEIEQEKRQ